jgi:hypothetical protein
MKYVKQRMSMRSGNAHYSACPSGGEAQPPPFPGLSVPEATCAARMRFVPAVVQACAGVTWRRPRTAQQCSPGYARFADRDALAFRPRPDVAAALMRG